ncbi:MAG: T9SS type A sorting domain-containing protein [Saprospiraceae bacterium]|nr:T9SS type A sorting domain-containing protein [Saprospiraceae bacterium]
MNTFFSPYGSACLSQAQSNGLAGYANVQVGIRQLGDMSEEARPSAAASLLSQNNGLTGSAAYQANEKAVNEIFLQTVAIGNYDFTAAQIASLEAIAELCPLSDGEAVLRARAMLNLLERNPNNYDDFVNCYGGERSDNTRRKTTPPGQSLKLFPNPVQDVFTVEYNGLSDSGQRLALFNVFGQAVMAINLPESHGRVLVTTSNLPAGVYWYAVPGENNFSGKLIISR